ncbi:MAG: DNA polymerase III subunit gamma/tau [Eggerthellaceae bacterium]|nr:DNA polymerase III subunit gamma/tau [Eggerthellaceae bacterium]
MAEALYRKYRPQVFEDVVGQDHIVRTIRNAILSDKISHFYMFCGPRGTGKTSTARILAKALLCERGPGPSPDGSCPHCLSVANGTHTDVYELDAASRTGVENVREEIIGRVQFAPTSGRYKIYIIDEAHMLSTAAFNALLKTLEEPPAHVVFILCTTDPQKVPETIHSRCQRFDFRRISAETIVTRLGAICIAEEVEFEGDALDLIAHRAEGGVRDALTSLDQLITFGKGKVLLKDAEGMLGSLDANDMAEIVAAIASRDIAKCFTWTANYIETGADLAQFVRDLAHHFRNMYILTLSNSDTVLEVSEVLRRELALEMQHFDVDRLTRVLAVLGELSSEMRTSSNPRLSFEIALTRLVRPDADLTLESLAERVEVLEARLARALQASAGPAQKREGFEESKPSIVSVRMRPGATLPENYPSGAVRLAVERGQVKEAIGEPAAATAAAVAAATAAAGVTAAVATTATAATAAAAVAAAAPEVAAVAQPALAPAVALHPEKLENPATLQRIWKHCLQIIKKNNPAYGVLFPTSKVSYDSSKGEVVIEFPAENMFAYSVVRKPEVMTMLAEALDQAAGMKLPFRFVQIAMPAKPAAYPAPEQAASPYGAQQAVMPEQAASVLQPAPVPEPVVEPQASQLDFSENEENIGDGSAAMAVDPSPEETENIGDGSSLRPDPSPEETESIGNGSSLRPDPSPASPEVDFQSLLSETFGGRVIFKEIDEEK